VCACYVIKVTCHVSFAAMHFVRRAPSSHLVRQAVLFCTLLIESGVEPYNVPLDIFKVFEGHCLLKCRFDASAAHAQIACRGRLLLLGCFAC
jgi:hypothetical protein